MAQRLKIHSLWNIPADDSLSNDVIFRVIWFPILNILYWIHLLIRAYTMSYLWIVTNKCLHIDCSQLKTHFSREIVVWLQDIWRRKSYNMAKKCSLKYSFLRPESFGIGVKKWRERRTKRNLKIAIFVLVLNPVFHLCEVAVWVWEHYLSFLVWILKIDL